jgi:hypothetical protein
MSKKLRPVSKKTAKEIVEKAKKIWVHDGVLNQSISTNVQVTADIIDEVTRAQSNYPKFNSAHEGYAVLLEEVDELWDLVKVKQARHDHKAMREEAVQIAAMAVRFILDICG